MMSSLQHSHSVGDWFQNTNRSSYTRALIVNLVVNLVFAGLSGCMIPPAGKSSSGRLPDVPLVVGGGGGSSDSSGSSYQTVDGNPEIVSEDAPILRVAHFAIVPSSSITVRSGAESSGNTPDKFVWHGDYLYVVDGKPLDIQITIDGRAHTFAVGGKRFHLAQGNYFRITVLPGPAIQTVQIPIVDILENDPEKVKEVVNAHP